MRYKIIFVGDANTGKTSIINRIIDNPFNETYEPSEGIDFISKNIRFNGLNIRIQIWDSAGQEKYRGLIPSYVRNSSLVFIVYDVSHHETFDNVEKWISFVKNFEKKTTIILCGNKIDLRREVETKEGEELAHKEGLLFYECSAKTNEDIKNMFFSSIVVLPIFGTYDESERKDLINELLEENGEVYQKGDLYQELIIEPKGKINEYREKIEDNKKEKNIKNEENKKEKNIDIIKKI